MTVVRPPRVAVIVVAAGSGVRLGASEPKAFVGIDAHSMLWHALQGVFASHPTHVIVVAPAGREGQALADALDVAPAARELVSVVAGGQTRQESVAAGLRALWADDEFVLVHDAARAFTPPDVFQRVVAALIEGRPAVLPVVPVVDTLKNVAAQNVVGETDRAALAAAQTPQGFRRDILEAAYRVAESDFTDDAALVRAAGHEVSTVPGAGESFKVTTPVDLERARGLKRPAAPSAMPPVPRVGIGTDVHAFGGDDDLWLAGVHWPGERGLHGHSDGDAVGHAIVDAVLAAAGLGDIGTHFGTSAPEYAGAHADAFLTRTRELVEEAGYRIVNVSVQVQARRPRMAGRREETERVLTAALGAPVSVSATTTDGLGFTGVGDGVFAIAVASVLPVG